MTPFEWTRGRLRAMATSLLVISSIQILKWLEPLAAIVESKLLPRKRIVARVKIFSPPEISFDGR